MPEVPLKHTRVDPPSEIKGETGEPLLQHQRDGEKREQSIRRRDRLRVQQPDHRVLAELPGSDEEQDADHEGRDALDAAMPERVLAIRRPGGNLEPPDHDDRREHVSERVEGVRNERDAADQDARDHLDREDDHVDDDAHPTFEHAVRLPGVGLTDPFRI